MMAKKRKVSRSDRTCSLPVLLQSSPTSLLPAQSGSSKSPWLQQPRCAAARPCSPSSASSSGCTAIGESSPENSKGLCKDRKYYTITNKMAIEKKDLVNLRATGPAMQLKRMCCIHQAARLLARGCSTSSGHYEEATLLTSNSSSTETGNY